MRRAIVAAIAAGLALSGCSDGGGKDYTASPEFVVSFRMFLDEQPESTRREICASIDVLGMDEFVDIGEDVFAEDGLEYDPEYVADALHEWCS